MGRMMDMGQRGGRRMLMGEGVRIMGRKIIEWVAEMRDLDQGKIEFVV